MNTKFFYMIDGMKYVFDTLSEARRFVRLSMKADDIDATKLRGLAGMGRRSIIRHNAATGNAGKSFSW